MIDYDKILITITDARKARMCAPGIYEWFQVQGLADRFEEFKTVGVPASVILATENGYGEFVVRKKIEREGLDG